jgi:inorganic pyrophosphatase
MNLWHDVPKGDNAPEEVNAIIEISRGSSNKYEIDKKTGLIRLDRANYSAAAYPVDYGFIPQTLWEDGDALDVIVLSTWPIQTGVLVHLRPIGVLQMVDGKVSDYKIVGVIKDDQRWNDIQTIKDINKHRIDEISHFFETYKVLDGKKTKVKINGVGGKTEAIAAINKAIKMYKSKFN